MCTAFSFWSSVTHGWDEFSRAQRHQWLALSLQYIQKKSVFFCTDARFHDLVQVSLPHLPCIYHLCPPCPATDTTLSLHSAYLPPHSCSLFPLFGMHFYFYLSPKFQPFFKVQLFKCFLPQELLVQTHCLWSELHDNFPRAFLLPVSHPFNPTLIPLLDYLDLTLFEYIRAAFPIFSLCVVCC